MILGHEAAGVVDACGPGATLAPGTRVAVEPGVSCGVCEHCLGGRRNICPDVRFLAAANVQGVYCEAATVPEANCLPIPDGMTLAEAAVLEPLGVGLHAAALARIEIGETVAVFGSGPIGLLTAMAARRAGAGRVWMTDLVPERLAFARGYAADVAIDARTEDPVARILEETDGRGVDVAFEAAGVQETVTQSVAAARVGGRAVLIGIPSETELRFDMHRMRRKELAVLNVRRSNWEVERALPMAAGGAFRLGDLATHAFPLERIEEAFRTVDARAEGVIRAVVEPCADLAGG